MKIGIVGVGLMGSKLGALFVRAGHEVLFSYARSEEKLERLAMAAGKRARAASVAEVGREADVILLAIHWSRLGDVKRQLGAARGKVIISCSLPMKQDDSALALGFTTSGAQALQRKFPMAQVVSAFGTVPSEVLRAVYAKRRQKRRPDLVYCGDYTRANTIAARLIRQLGFTPRHVGGLESARFLEPFALMVAALAYKPGANPALAYRFEHFRELG